MKLWEKVRATKDLWSGNVQKIADRIGKAQQKAGEITPYNTPPEQTTSPYDVTAGSLSGLSWSFGQNSDRFNLINDCWEMYLNDGRVRASLGGIAQLATSGDNNGRAFQITMAQGDTGDTKRKRVQAELDTFVDREGLALRADAPNVATYTMLEGDRFYEIVMDFTRNEVVELRHVPGPHEGFLMKRLEHVKTGQLLGWGLYDWTTLSLAHVYHPCQIARFCFDKVSRYGLPLPSSVRLQWKRLREQEADLYVARHARAGMKLVHRFEGAPEDKIKTLQAASEKRQRSNPTGPLSDLDTNATDVKAIDPKNSNLVNIDDVRYNQDAVLAGLQHQRGLMGLGDTQNRAVLEMQFQAEVPLFDKVTTMLTGPYLQIIRTQMILRGVNPAEYGIGLEWTEKDPTEWAKRHEAWTAAVGAGKISLETYHEKLGLNPESEAGRLQDQADRSLGLEEVENARHTEQRLFNLEAGLDDLRRSGNGKAIERIKALAGR